MRYADIIGQKDAVTQLKQFGEFFTSKGGTPGHVLLIGEEGMGKRTIATAFANELGVPLQTSASLRQSTPILCCNMKCMCWNTIRRVTVLAVNEVDQTRSGG
jgi:Holliday junction resolvasome RuvABC ATP-dependent DNA helicase subunit